MELTLSINSEVVRLKEVGVDEKSVCKNCFYGQKEIGTEGCPKIVKDNWSGYACELLAKNVFHFKKV